MFRRSLAAALLLSTAAAPAQDAPLPPDQAAMRAHVRFLAADAMRGREAGSPEYDIAAHYVAAQFEAAGLKPAGEAGSYLQKVPLIAFAPADEGKVIVNGRALAFGTDYLPAATPAAAETTVAAPAVFVGHGIQAPQYGIDDFAGLDVRGKIVVVAAGAPARMTGEERAFFGSPATKARFAAAHGAVGIVTFQTPLTEKVRPFAKSMTTWQSTRMTWAKADGSGNVDTPGTPALATLSLTGAAKLFGARWAAVQREAAKGDARFRAEALPATLSVATHTKRTPVTSWNVAGMVPGSDPALAAETVILSAHLDHIGVTKPDPTGDAINNGAMDNAVGIASLIEAAKRFATGTRPRRSVLFLAVTAEEKGLVGSDYFANHPTVPAAGIVADVNLDMPILTYRFEDMVAFGGDRSTLGPIIQRAVSGIGVGLSPDPMPEEGIFVRSDHFRFVQKGVPSVFLWPGQKGEGRAAVADFMAHRYHQPGDDLTQPIRWDQGVRFVDANYRIAREIADAPTRPVWNKGDYFGTLFKGPIAR
jgi:hypothetical protein